MAQEKRSIELPYNYKISDKAETHGYSGLIDGQLITVYPTYQTMLPTSSGQMIPGEWVKAKTVIKDPKTGDQIECLGGFKELTPRQVYELSAAGIIILSSRRKEHFETIQKYLKANVTNINPEDY